MDIPSNIISNLQTYSQTKSTHMATSERRRINLKSNTQIEATKKNMSDHKRIQLNTGDIQHAINGHRKLNSKKNRPPHSKRHRLKKQAGIPSQFTNKLFPALLLLFVVLIGPLLIAIKITNGNSEVVYKVLSPVLLTIAIWTFIQIFYFIFLSIFGFKKAVRDYDILNDETKFLIFIPCHNEEQVIASTIANLKKLNYDKNLYKIVVINDNSVDNTEFFSRKSGAAVINTCEKKYPSIGVGKPKALQYTFFAFKDEGILENFDMVLVLDADNYVDSNLLIELNSQFIHKNRPEAIQTYLDSKNHDTSLSRGYAASYWCMNRFFQLSKYRLGLPNSIGGTGFAVSTKWLNKFDGFTATSLTEDLEMGIKIVENDGRVLWNHFARIYDEKPTVLKSSLIQRFRWSKGHWFVAFTYLGRLIKKFLKKPHFKYIDQIGYLFSMRGSIQIFVTILLLSTWLFGRILGSDELFMLNWFSSYYIIKTPINFFVLIYGFVLSTAGFVIDGKSKKNFLSILKTNISLLYFSFTYYFCQIWGLFNWKSQASWAKTKHSITYENDISI